MQDQAPEFAVGWGALALINAGVAPAKCRSGLNWFLLSLLFGPLATFILVIVEKGEPPTPKSEKMRFDLKKYCQQ